MRRQSPGGIAPVAGVGSRIFSPLFVLVSLTLLLPACGNDSTAPEDSCNISALPLQSTADGPTITDVGLEIQPSGVVVLATATDPQGTDNLLGIEQSIGIFPDAQCQGTSIVVLDDLAGSGLEESFGTAIDASVNASLYHLIAAGTSWPVEVDFKDQDGHRTTGRLQARVIR